MTFSIDDAIFKAFPTLHLGVVVARGIDNHGEHPELLQLLQQECQRIRNAFDLETLQDQPRIASWREAYQAFGAKPKKYTCSVENLYRMILEGVELRHINTLVDLYNVLSLQHMVPVGGDDLDKVEGNINLRFARGEEPFIRLNSDELDHPKPGEVIYADDKEVLCRRWNWRECDKSKMNEATKNVALVVEALEPVNRDDLGIMVDELAELVERFCGGSTKSFFLDREHPGADL